MKKYIYVTIAVCAVLIFSLQSCKKDENKTPATDKIHINSYGVSNGRLVFDNYAQMKAKIDELYKMNATEFNAWEKSKGFTSYNTYRNYVINENWENYQIMKENAPEKEYNKYVTPDLSLVANQNIEYQVGDSIFFLVDNKIYGLAYDGEERFKELKSQISDKSLKSIKQNLWSYEIKIDTLKTTTKLKTTGFGTYQSEPWGTNSETFKIVFQAIACPDFTNSKMRYVVVQNKLEYWHVRSWPKKPRWEEAGQSIYKSVYNFSINDISGGSILSNPNDKYKGPLLDNTFFPIKSKSFYPGKYVTIGGAIEASTFCFDVNNTYNKTADCLWDAYVY